jgi:hypothetical protein
VTYGTPTWIWSVAVDDALYVRGYNGQNSRWYQAAVRQKAGRIIAAGMTKEVTFEPVNGPINNRIEDAYRAKYHGKEAHVSDSAKAFSIAGCNGSPGIRCHLSSQAWMRSFASRRANSSTAGLSALL